MVFLTKVKSEHRDGDMSSQASNAYIQLKSTDLSAMLFKGKWSQSPYEQHLYKNENLHKKLNCR